MDSSRGEKLPAGKKELAVGLPVSAKILLGRPAAVWMNIAFAKSLILLRSLPLCQILCGVGKVLGSLKSLAEWDLRHTKSVFANCHSL